MHLKAILHSSDASEDSASQGAAEALQRRFAQRRSLELSAVANSPKAGETRVLVRDISPGGILIEAEADDLCVGDSVEVHLPDLGVATARVVWTSGRFFGCQFSDPISTSAISAALLKAKPPTQKLEQDAQYFESKWVRFEPTLNFSFAFFLAFVLWALIAMVAYLVSS